MVTKFTTSNLNPMDYHVWSMKQECYRGKVLEESTLISGGNQISYNTV